MYSKQATEAGRKLAKRKKKRSKNKANRVCPQAREGWEETASRAEAIAVQDKRLVYAGGVAVIVILIGVIWLAIYRSSKESLLQPSQPRAKWLDQATESAANRSATSKDSSTQGQILDSSKSGIGAAASTKVFRDRLKSGGEGLEMVEVAAGSFQMGDLQGGRDKAALPVRTVRIQKPFAIGRYGVTFEEYDKFAQATKRELPNDGGGGRGRQP